MSTLGRSLYTQRRTLRSSAHYRDSDVELGEYPGVLLHTPSCQVSEKHFEGNETVNGSVQMKEFGLSFAMHVEKETNSLESSPSREANRSSTIQKISRLLRII